MLKGTADFLALNFYSVSFAEHHDLSNEENMTWDYFTDQEMKASRDPSWLIKVSRVLNSGKAKGCLIPVIEKFWFKFLEISSNE